MTLPNPLPPLDPRNLPPPPQFGAPKMDGNIQQVVARGTTRVEISAWVNGVPIFKDEVMHMCGPELVRLGNAADKQAELLVATVNQLIDQEVQYQDLIKKIDNNPKAKKELKQFVDREFEKTVDKWRAAKPPVSEDQIKQMEPPVRRLLQRNLVSTEYARARIMDLVKGMVNMEAIKEHYETHLTEFRTVDRVVWQNYFVPVSPNLPTVADVKRFMEGMIAKCRNADDFNRLSVYNEGPTKLNNHEGVGQRKGEIRPADLETHLFKLREGEIGPAIPFPNGVHLMRVMKREFETQLPMDAKVQNTIRKKMENDLLEKEHKRIIKELRDRAVIEIVSPR